MSLAKAAATAGTRLILVSVLLPLAIEYVWPTLPRLGFRPPPSDPIITALVILGGLLAFLGFLKAYFPIYTIQNLVGHAGDTLTSLVAVSFLFGPALGGAPGSFSLPLEIGEATFQVEARGEGVVILFYGLVALSLWSPYHRFVEARRKKASAA